MSNALFVAWRSGDASHGSWGPVGRLEFDGRVFRFWYTQGARTQPGFRPFAGMSDLNQVYEAETLFPVFANRLLSPSRPEYEAFLVWGGFDPNNPPDPIALLSVTEGIRQTDSIEVFPCPVPDAGGCYVNKFFLHGVRWMPAAALERISKLQPGERLYLMVDFSNEYDPNAMAVRTSDRRDRFMIGYVPRYLAHDVRQLCAMCEPNFIRLFAERVNRDAPLQQRVLSRMQACWPAGFEPCSGPDYEPIPQGVPIHCNER
jgi:hypothetical protein